MAAIRWIVCSTVLAMVAPAVAPAPQAGALPAWDAVYPASSGDLLSSEVGVPPIPPTDPAAALTQALKAFGARLGVPLEPTSRLNAAQLKPGLAGRLAALLQDLRVCQDITTRLLANLRVPPSALLAEDVARGEIPEGAEMRVCAGQVLRSGTALQRYLASAPEGQGPDVEVWPVLRLDLDGTNDVVVHDYVLSIDRAGNDRYFNSAGGSPLDLRRGPKGSGSPENGPSRGCVNPLYDLHDGQCTLAAALLIDLAGDDTYGRMEAPDADAICTDEPLVRRVLTAGTGFAGVGVLMDGAGDDTYLGKGITQGAGHVGGVGVLQDEGGDDVYHAMRLSKGFGVAGGLGVLHDGGGNDRYTYYMPRAIDPKAPYKTPGSGGGFTTTGLCDNQARWDEGTGIAGGVGVLVEDGGDDFYQAAEPLDHLFGTTEPLRRTGSLGYGDFQGFGVMIDRSGLDRYTGMPGRTNGTTVQPTPEATGYFSDASGASAAMSSGGAGGGTLAVALNNHFLPETINLDQGGTLQFVNIDGLSDTEFHGHTLTDLHQPPRFTSAVVAFPEASEVDGVSSLAAGTYTFFCQVHPFMRGTLVVR